MIKLATNNIILLDKEEIGYEYSDYFLENVTFNHYCGNLYPITSLKYDHSNFAIVLLWDDNRCKYLLSNGIYSEKQGKIYFTEEIFKDCI